MNFNHFRNYRFYFLAHTLILLFSTTVSHADFLDHFNNKEDPIENPTPAKLSVCFQHSCTQINHISLNDNEWQQVTNFFTNKEMDTPEQERHQIAKAIAWLEIAVGKKINTLDDRGGNLEGLRAKGNQLDCVDEATNSTTYLIMMERSGLLQHHQVERHATRGFILFGGIWPHSTAVIKELATGNKWAVDSWFFDNGQRPTIVPLKKWRSGWSPSQGSR